jgi:hypothetical protein
MALPTVGLLSGLEIWDVLSGVPVVLEQKTTILWKCLYLLAFFKDLLAWIGCRRQIAEVGKKPLWIGEIPQ